MSNILKSEKGFTLIELLIVLTILVALTLTGTYKYFNIIETNKQKIDISNANILADAVNVAEATGQIDIDSSSNVVTYENLKNVLNKKLSPTSKLYSGKNNNGEFLIKVSKNNNDLSIIVSANDIELYPVVKKQISD